MVNRRVLAAAPVSTASKLHDALAKVIEQVAVAPLKQPVALVAVGVVLTVPRVTVLAVALLKDAVPTPLLITTVSPPTQPVGDSCTVTLPGYRVVQAAFRQAFMVTTSGVQIEPAPSCSI